MTTADDALDAVSLSAMLWNTPLSEAPADLLLGVLGVSDGDRVLDLGCAWGGLPAQAVTAGGPRARVNVVWELADPSPNSPSGLRPAS